MNSSDIIREAVTEYLAERCITYIVKHMGARTKGPSGDAWDCDAWLCAFSRNGRQEEFDFFTGAGLRKAPKWACGPGMRGIYDGTAKPPRPGTLLYAEWQKQARPVAPHAADVLHCLILDASAVGRSFESWCGEYGYDTDSRKAEATYRACQQTGDKLVRVFGPQVVDELAAMLEGY